MTDISVSLATCYLLLVTCYFYLAKARRFLVESRLSRKGIIMSTEQQQSGAFVTERHQNPGIISEQPVQENFTWAAVVACITAVLFIVLIAMQWMDLQALSLA